jgi:hypothetical protein
MGENGSERRSNIWREVAGQVSDHVDLASVEMRYEAQMAGRKLLAAGIIFILVLTGFIVLQVALIGALMKTGLSLGNSALCFLRFLLSPRPPRLLEAGSAR